MKKTKLGINTTAAILDIINAILFTTSWFVVTFMAFSESFAGGTDLKQAGLELSFM